jgi:hypothetical protein
VVNQEDINKDYNMTVGELVTTLDQFEEDCNISILIGSNSEEIQFFDDNIQIKRDGSVVVQIGN